MFEIVTAEDACRIIFDFAERGDLESSGDKVINKLCSWRVRFSQAYDDSGNRNGSGNCTSSACDADRHDRTFSIWLELVDDCNLDCVFCYNPWRPPDSELRAQPILSYESLVHAINKIMDSIPVDHVILSGGEPLLYRRLASLTAMIGDRCSSIGMTTNGRSLTRNRLADLASAGLSQISVPVHSSVAAIHDELAGGRSWRAAIRALAFGLELGVSVTMSSVVTTRNARNIVNVIKIGLGLGIGTVVLNCFHPTGQGGGRDELELCESEFNNVVGEARDVIGDRGKVFIGSPPTSRKETRTRADRLILSPFGDVKLCNQSSTGIVSLIDDPASKLDDLIHALSTGTYGEYLARIDSCSCFS